MDTIILKQIVTVNNLFFNELINLANTCKDFYECIFKNQFLLVALIKRGIIINNIWSSLPHKFNTNLPFIVSIKFTKKYKDCKELKLQLYERLFTQIKNGLIKCFKMNITSLRSKEHVLIGEKNRLKGLDNEICKFNPKFKEPRKNYYPGGKKINWGQCYKCQTKKTKRHKDTLFCEDTIKTKEKVKLNINNYVEKISDYVENKVKHKINIDFWFRLFSNEIEYYKKCIDNQTKICKTKLNTYKNKLNKYNKLLSDVYKFMYIDLLIKHTCLTPLEKANLLASFKYALLNKTSLEEAKQMYDNSKNISELANTK